jgi:hypothetical protein
LEFVAFITWKQSGKSLITSVHGLRQLLVVRRLNVARLCPHSQYRKSEQEKLAVEAKAYAQCAGNGKRSAPGS